MTHSRAIFLKTRFYLLERSGNTNTQTTFLGNHGSLKIFGSKRRPNFGINEWQPR